MLLCVVFVLPQSVGSPSISEQKKGHPLPKISLLLASSELTTNSCKGSKFAFVIPHLAQ